MRPGLCVCVGTNHRGSTLRISVGEPNWRREKGGPQHRTDAFVDGTWWPAGHDDLRASGKVSAFAEGSVWLDIDSDPWREVAHDGEQSSIDVRTLHGQTTGGTPLSLHGVRFVGGQSDPLVDQAHVRYVADRLVFGAAVETEDDIRLTAVQTSFRGLREWLMGGPHDTSTPLPLVRSASVAGEGGDAARLDEWVRLLSVEVDGVRIQATVASRRASTSAYETIYKTSASLQLETDEPLALTQWRRQWIEPLRDLVLFGTREQTVALWLRGQHEDSEVEVYSPPDTTLLAPSHVEYHQRHLLPAGIWDQDGFKELVANWRRLHTKLGPVAQALFEVWNTADLAPLTRLLRLTSCAEGYHRAAHNEPPFSDEQHDEMLAAMIDALPDEKSVRSHYKDRLRYANSQSQRRRIRWLIENATTADERLQGQARRLTDRLVGWRDAHTHLDGEIETPPLDDLLLLNAVLTYVLEANILLDIGIGDNTRYCLGHGYVWDDPIAELLASQQGDQA